MIHHYHSCKTPKPGQIILYPMDRKDTLYICLKHKNNKIWYMIIPDKIYNPEAGSIFVYEDKFVDFSNGYYYNLIIKELLL